MYTIFTTETLHHFTINTLFGKPNAPSFSFGKSRALIMSTDSHQKIGARKAECFLARYVNLNFLLQRQMRISANKVCDL